MTTLTRETLAFLVLCAAWPAAVWAEGGLEGWELVRTVDTDRADPGLKSVHTPALEKHFTFADGILRGKIGLGKEFFEAKKVDTLQGVGTIWAAKKDWPKDLADFEVSWEFQWVMPDKGFADCPFMLVGFRLNADGEGYSLGMHGYSAPLQFLRIAKEKTRQVGRGRYDKYIAPGWLSLRLRAVGPILKAKVWRSGTPEPERWTTEVFDDWTGATSDTYRKGGLAFGFSGVKVFDTASHEYRNIQFKPLSAEEAKVEVSFCAKTGPDYQADIGLTEKLNTKGREDLLKSPPALDSKMLESCAKDKNLVLESGPEGTVLKSADGAPAFLWLPESKRASFAVVQAKASAGGRPLFALREASAGPAEYYYLDPAWRDGLAAMLYRDAKHTSDIVRSQWKPDTWLNLVTQRSHIQTWRVLEPEGKDLAAFRCSCGAGHGKAEVFGIGVAGQGTVTVKGFAAK